jgi:hypothetical protein
MSQTYSDSWRCKMLKMQTLGEALGPAPGAHFRECQEFPLLVRHVAPTPRAGKRRPLGCRTPKSTARLSGGLLVLEEAADLDENSGVHGEGDAAGLRVLLAGVINAE